MNPPDGDTVLWDEEDGFYYDVLRQPDGTTVPLKVRSLVGLLPLCAATVFDGDLLERYPSTAGAARGVHRAASPMTCPSWPTLPARTPRASASPRSSTSRVCGGSWR